MQLPGSMALCRELLAELPPNLMEKVGSAGIVWIFLWMIGHYSKLVSSELFAMEHNGTPQSVSFTMVSKKSPFESISTYHCHKKS